MEKYLLVVTAPHSVDEPNEVFGIPQFLEFLEFSKRIYVVGFLLCIHLYFEEWEISFKPGSPTLS